MRGVERQRRRSLAEELHIVAEVDEADAGFAQVVLWHDVSRGQL